MILPEVGKAFMSSRPMPGDTSVAAKLAKVNVLILDNDSKIIGLLRNVMKTLGFGTFFEAKDGFEGVNILRENAIDLIITDWELRPLRTSDAQHTKDKIIKTAYGEFTPNNGASFVKCLRCSPRSPNPFIPVIMLTGPTDKNNIHFARDAGVNEILMKPLEAEHLANRIIAIIEKPRPFVTSETYKGPCRRRKQMIPIPGNIEDRRIREIRVIRHNELRSTGA